MFNPFFISFWQLRLQNYIAHNNSILIVTIDRRPFINYIPHILEIIPKNMIMSDC